MNMVQIQRGDSRKLLTNGQCPPYFLPEALLQLISIKFLHWTNNRGKYGDGFDNSIVDNKDHHLPSTLIMFTCTALRHALLQCQKSKGVHPRGSKSKLEAGRPDRSNNFNYNNNSAINVFCTAATGCKLFTWPGVAATYAFLMNTSSTLPESCQLSLYSNTLAPIQCRIHQMETRTPAVVICMEVARIANAVLLHYLTANAALEEPELASTDPNIPIDYNCKDDALH